MTDATSEFETLMRAAIEAAREGGDLLAEALLYASFVGVLFYDTSDSARLDALLVDALKAAIENRKLVVAGV